MLFPFAKKSVTIELLAKIAISHPAGSSELELPALPSYPRTSHDGRSFLDRLDATGRSAL